jgi:hypothetical protein
MRVNWVASAFVGFILLTGTPAAAEPVPPQVRITMTDGVTAPKTGDGLTYTIALVDRGTEPLSAQIRMTAPDGLADLTAPDGDVTGRTISWTARIAAGDTLTVSFTATVAAPATRLAATACAYIDAGGRPIACASDLDQVVRPPAHHRSRTPLLLGGIVLLALLIAGFLAWQRNRPEPPPSDLDDPATTYDQRNYTDVSP